jgi:hypothetical protein
LRDYHVHEVAMATLTRGVLEEPGLSTKGAERMKNMFALGPAVLDVPPAGRRQRADRKVQHDLVRIMHRERNSWLQPGRPRLP